MMTCAMQVQSLYGVFGVWGLSGQTPGVLVLGQPIVCVPDSLHPYNLVTLSTLTFPKVDSEAPKCQFLNQATFQR